MYLVDQTTSPSARSQIQNGKGAFGPAYRNRAAGVEKRRPRWWVSLKSGGRNTAFESPGPGCMNKLDTKTRTLILRCLVEGNRIRATARLANAACASAW
jgi:hypothetical protein